MRLDFFYDIVCPYAYLASTQIEALAARRGAELVWRPMLLGGVFRHIGRSQNPMQTMSAPRARLNMLDMHRWAEHFDVPLTMPTAHPRRSVETMRLLVGAPEATRPALSHALYRAYWVDGLDIAQRAVLDPLARAHGVDPKVIDSPEARAGLFASTAEAAELGAFGVPACVVDGTLYWGQDRLHLVERALGGPDRAARDAARPAPEPLTGGDRSRITFFHDFASPFSYLAATQIARVAERHGAELVWKPILLGGLFRAIGTPDVPLFEMNAPKRQYMGRDLRDWAGWWGVPFQFPTAFPMRSVLPLRMALAEPRLTPHLYRAAWAEDRPIAEPAVAEAVADEAGFDGAALLARASDPVIKGALRANTEAARAAGACGVPTCVIDGPTAGGHRARPILFWGQDRLDLVERALTGWRPTCG